jgi:endonuclease/exonuclease/phosphatase family metal-dependent hydrolase
VYIPPKQSTYSSEEAFNELEDEIIFVSKNTKHITLVGDFNSKTSTLEYFIISDQD